MRNIQIIIYLILLVSLLLLSSCGPSAEEKAATQTKIADDIFATQTAGAPTATYTPLPSATRTPTPNQAATANYRRTQKAQPMADFVEQLYADGYLNSTVGKYMELDNYTQSFAQINWVDFYPTRKKLGDFILRSDIAWKTAKEGANIYYSGCGFWFGADNSIENFHSLLITLDGKVNLSRCLNNCRYFDDLASSYFGKVDYMSGNAELIIIVEGSTIQAFINGERVFVRYDQKKLTGDLHYAISSGTNAGFGTRCTFTDTEIWSLEP